MRVPPLLALAVLGGTPVVGPPLGPSNLVRVSVDSVGRQSNADSNTAALSPDGNYVAFVSSADNLVPGDGNHLSDVFLHHLRTGATTRVSVGDAGQEAELECLAPSVSRDGRRVVFQSDSANLVPGDTNGFADVFLRDIEHGTTSRVSLGMHGNEAELPCFEPALSADGRTVAFVSYATNLGAGWTIGIQDVFVRDLVLGTLECVSVGPAGVTANHSSWDPSLSADGRYVAFYSQASNLVPFDANGAHDVFVHDRQTGLTEMVSVSSTGAQANGPSVTCQISADGRFVAFTSHAGNLVPGDHNTDSDVFVHDRASGTTELASQSSFGEIGDEESDHPGISGDGRWVVFHSMAENLGTPDDQMVRDVYLRDRLLGTTVCLSIGLHLGQTNEESQGPVIAADMPMVAFESPSGNLVTKDTNQSTDIFVGNRE
jgi:Tol biopolymer transport system component